MNRREEVIEAALAMSRSGLSPGRSGNVSLRDGGRIFITPTGMAYAGLAPEDIVPLDLEGRVLSGHRLPSSEWHFHCAIYRARPEVGAIVHSHSLNATALACSHREIPAFHYMVAVAGGNSIRCAPYATFGTEQLAENVVAALKDRSACLIANHGQVAVGPSLNKALDLAHEVETLADQYARVLDLGEVHLLDDEEMVRVIEKFRTYGQQPEKND